MLLVAACFLADALRRLKQQFNRDARIEQDKKVMGLHVIAIFTYTFFGLLLQAAVIYYFINPCPWSNDFLSYTRMIMLTSQSVSQVIMIYLIVRFSKPDEPVSDVESLSDAEYRDPNLEKFYYLSDLPKMKRGTTKLKNLSGSFKELDSFLESQ